MKATQQEKECMKRYYQRHKEKIKKRINLYRLAHKEEDLLHKKEYRNKNKAKVTISTRNWIHRKYDEIQTKLGGKCKRCGFSDKRALHIHHKEEKTKKARRDFIQKGYDLNKIELICANCHMIEHHNFFNSNNKKYV